jgi:hypothetical protein
MSRLRFSLASLLLAVTMVAFTSAALRYSNDLWSHAALNLSGVVLLVAILMAMLSQSTCRAFWLGFSLFGWAYFLASVGPWSPYFGERLLTTSLLARVERHFDHEQAWAQSNGSSAAYIDALVLKRFSLGSVILDSPTPQTPVKTIGHSAIALLFGLLGGLIAVVVQGRRPAPSGQSQ